VVRIPINELPPLRCGFYEVFSNKTIGGGTVGAAWAETPSLLFLGGPGPPLFCLNIVSLSNTISIGYSDKVNR